ncbi:hypothetical protein HDZ31DRAFT_73891 [Schizophyllum fasciatum]
MPKQPRKTPRGNRPHHSKLFEELQREVPLPFSVPSPSAPLLAHGVDLPTSAGFSPASRARETGAPGATEHATADQSTTHRASCYDKSAHAVPYPAHLARPKHHLVMKAPEQSAPGPLTNGGAQAATSAQEGEDEFSDMLIINIKPKLTRSKRCKRNADADVSRAVRDAPKQSVVRKADEGDAVKVEHAADAPKAGRDAQAGAVPPKRKRGPRHSNRSLRERIEALTLDDAVADFGAHHVVCAGCWEDIVLEHRRDAYPGLFNKHTERCWDIYTWTCINDPAHFNPPSQELLAMNAERRKEAARRMEVYFATSPEACKCRKLGLELSYLDDDKLPKPRCNPKVADRSPEYPLLKVEASSIKIFVGGRLERIMPHQYEGNTLAKYVAARKRADMAPMQGAMVSSASTHGWSMQGGRGDAVVSMTRLLHADMPAFAQTWKQEDTEVDEDELSNGDEDWNRRLPGFDAAFPGFRNSWFHGMKAAVAEQVSKAAAGRKRHYEEM